MDWSENFKFYKWVRNLPYGLRIYDETFPNLKKVIAKGIFNHKQKRLPEKINEFKKVEVLNLENNHYKKLPSTITDLTELRVLNLSDNKFKKIPKELQELNNLTSLDLSKNKIKKVPDWLQGMTQLRTLNLSVNQIKEIPEWINELKNLEALILDNNELTSLPNNIEDLDKLRNLSINYNKVESINYLPYNIEKLGIAKNSITSIPYINEGIKIVLAEKDLLIDNFYFRFNLVNSETQIIKQYGFEMRVYITKKINDSIIDIESVNKYLKSIKSNKGPDFWIKEPVTRHLLKTIGIKPGENTYQTINKSLKNKEHQVILEDILLHTNPYVRDHYQQDNLVSEEFKRKAQHEIKIGDYSILK